MNPDAHDPRIDEGIDLFNRREFFACHDVFEDLWSEMSGPEKSFVQGLIHAAVCLFHFEGENLSGARKMYSTFQIYIDSMDDGFLGIDTITLKKDMADCFHELLQITSGYPSHIKLNESKIPRIHRNS